MITEFKCICKSCNFHQVIKVQVLNIKHGRKLERCRKCGKKNYIIHLNKTATEIVYLHKRKIRPLKLIKEIGKVLSKIDDIVEHRKVVSVFGTTQEILLHLNQSKYRTGFFNLNEQVYPYFGELRFHFNEIIDTILENENERMAFEAFYDLFYYFPQIMCIQDLKDKFEMIALSCEYKYKSDNGFKPMSKFEEFIKLWNNQIKYSNTYLDKYTFYYAYVRKENFVPNSLNFLQKRLNKYNTAKASTLIAIWFAIIKTRLTKVDGDFENFRNLAQSIFVKNFQRINEIDKEKIRKFGGELIGIDKIDFKFE